jgi:alpha-L-rhamnosidase
LKFNVEKNLSEWFTSIRNAQRYDGNIPGIIPTTGWGFDWGNGPLFDSVIFNVPYYMYLYLGDTDIIKDNAIMMMRYLDFISKKRDERGLICYGLGDWCPVNKNCDDYDVPLEFTDSAMTMDSARKAALMFRAAGLENQAEFAEGLYYEMRDAIRSNLIDFNTMTVEGASQTGQAIALAFGIFDPAERSEAYTRLLEAVSEYDEHIHTGILGGRYIFHVLRDFGDADLAYHMITRKDFPSYGYWMEQGATTLWEIFHKDVNYYSTNHHFWGDVTSWFVKTALGIRVNPNEDNPNHIDIEPYFISDMDSASGHYDSLCGKLEVKWIREGENVRFTVICPEGITGKIKLPFGFKHNDKYVLPLKAGTNEIIATKTF